MDATREFSEAYNQMARARNMNATVGCARRDRSTAVSYDEYHEVKASAAWPAQIRCDRAAPVSELRCSTWPATARLFRVRSFEEKIPRGPWLSNTPAATDPRICGPPTLDALLWPEITKRNL